MACQSCAEKRKALKGALMRRQVVVAAQIATAGAVQIAKTLLPKPRKTKPKGR
jgi:hypothetical protein